MNLSRLIIISGLSGSGKSTAARALEDEGFFVVDNLPVVLLPRFLQTIDESAVETTEIAVVLDVRNRHFLLECEKILDEVEAFGIHPEILFLDADDSDIQRRYSETRRCHPLAREKGVSEGIRLERKHLTALRSRASITIDSSQLTPHQLRARVAGIVHGQEERSLLTVQFQSFGFRYGLPPDSDMVLDVRFLSNPHFVPELQPLTGLEASVSRYVLGQKETDEFLLHLKEFLVFLIPRYQAEGKSYLTVSIGCTGGRHRSVAIVEELVKNLSQSGLHMKSLHRDISREEG